jgi:hypothetical protein
LLDLQRAVKRLDRAFVRRVARAAIPLLVILALLAAVVLAIGCYVALLMFPVGQD